MFVPKEFQNLERFFTNITIHLNGLDTTVSIEMKII
jgi:hypothetical protein